MNVKELISAMQNGAYDSNLKAVYLTDGAVDLQKPRYVEALNSFGELFGFDREVSIMSAPGRTEVCGNHTDHNNGVVIAAAVNLDIIAVVAKNDENVVRVISHGFGKIDDVNLRDLTPQPVEAEHSASLIRGVAAGIVKDGGCGIMLLPVL